MDMAYAHASHDTVASSARATSYYMSTSDQPAGFGSEPSTGSGMTVSVLGVTSYLRGCKNGGCNGVPVRDTNLTLALPLALTLNGL